MDFQTNLKDFFSLGVSNLIASIIFGIFWIFIASIVTKNEYGELGFLMSIANVGFAVSMLGLGSTIVVYESKNERVFPASFVLGTLASVITAIIIYFFTQNIPVSILIIGMTLSSLILFGLNSRKKYSLFSVQVIIKAVSSLVLAILLYQFFGLNGILLGFFIGTLFLLKDLPGLMKNTKINFNLLKPKIHFILHNYAGRLSSVIFWWGDKLLIGILFGFSTLGSFHFAAQYMLLIESIPRSVGLYLLPQESEGLKNKNIKIIVILIAFFLTLLSIFVIPKLITIFLPEFQESILPIQIMSLSIIPITIFTIQQAEFLGKENSRVVLVGGIIQSVLYLILIIILGQLFGLTGIAIGFFLAMLVRVIFNTIVKIYSN